MTTNLTDEQIVMLQLRIMSALSFYNQRPEKEAKKMAELLTLAGVAASELQECRKAAYPVAWQCDSGSIANRRVVTVSSVVAESWVAKDMEVTALYAVPPAPDGWKLVPIEPTEDMIIEGFESAPEKFFSEEDVWAEYEKMSGCQKAAHRARLCWNAMLKAAPKLENI